MLNPYPQISCKLAGYMRMCIFFICLNQRAGDHLASLTGDQRHIAKHECYYGGIPQMLPLIIVKGAH